MRARSDTRQAMVAAPTSTSDAIRNAAPGCGNHASGPTEMEYTAPKNSGDSPPAIAPTLLLAPCSWPCSDSDTRRVIRRSEEHTSELQSLMRIAYAVFCLKKTHITTTP